jgi:hypothetical protein
MSNPQGSTPINVEYIDNIINQLNAIEFSNCPQITLLIQEDIPLISDLIKGIGDQMSNLSGLVSLLKLPFPDPGSIVSWLGDLVTGLIGPQLKALITYSIQLATLAAKLTQVIAAITGLLPKVAHCFLDSPLQLLNNIQNEVNNSLNVSLGQISKLQTSLNKINPTKFPLSNMLDTSNVQNFLASSDKNSSTLIASLTTA